MLKGVYRSWVARGQDKSRGMSRATDPSSGLPVAGCWLRTCVGKMCPGRQFKRKEGRLGAHVKSELRERFGNFLPWI